MASENRLDRMIDDILERRKPAAKSLMVSLFGDAILPHGGAIWMSSLAGLMAAFDCTERVVRTSVFRLAREGWLVSTQVGRRSFYSLTDTGTRRFDAAHRIIYAGNPGRWSERWTLVSLAMIEAPARDALRDELAWLGFGRLGADLMLHPAPDEPSLRKALSALPDRRAAVVMSAGADPWMGAEGVHALVARAWDIGRLGSVYDEFLEDFRPFLAAPPTSPLAAFRLRTLLIHAWRRAVLRDPLLPQELLPASWPGASARLLCRNLYRAIQAPAETWLAQSMETADGPPGPPSQSFYDRFGGLDERRAEPAS